MEYQHSWKWIKDNWQAPVPSVAYVTAISVGVGTKNVFSTAKHDVYVEKQPRAVDMMEDTAVCLPRICITRREDSIEAVVAYVDHAFWR